MNVNRIVTSAEDLIFYTNTDEANYTIYVLKNKEIVYKRRVDEYIAMFHVKSIEIDDAIDVNNELVRTAINAIKDIAKSDAEFIRLIITYEVYSNTSFIDEATAYAIKVFTKDIPYRGVKAQGRRAWAIAYDYLNRLKAKYQVLAKYAYCKSTCPVDEGRKGRGYPALIIKIPIATEQFTKLFNIALSQADTTHIDEIEEQIRKVEEAIKQKEAELQTLKEQLSQLTLKLQLEKMKKTLV